MFAILQYLGAAPDETTRSVASMVHSRDALPNGRAHERAVEAELASEVVGPHCVPVDNTENESESESESNIPEKDRRIGELRAALRDLLAALPLAPLSRATRRQPNAWCDVAQGRDRLYAVAAARTATHWASSGLMTGG